MQKRSHTYHTMPSEPDVMDSLEPWNNNCIKTPTKTAMKENNIKVGVFSAVTYQQLPVNP